MPKFPGLPSSTAADTTEIEEGTTSALAIPCIARNMISSIPVRDTPQASMKAARMKQPVRLIVRRPVLKLVMKLMPASWVIPPSRHDFCVVVRGSCDGSDVLNRELAPDWLQLLGLLAHLRRHRIGSAPREAELPSL
jgi:hypothetical protein